MRHPIFWAVLAGLGAAVPGEADTPIIGTSTAGEPINSAHKYFTHYANGHYWVAFDTGGIGGSFNSSPDGVTWTSQGQVFTPPPNINPNSSVNEWAVRYLGNTVIVAVYNAGGAPVGQRYYRSGTLNSDGTVTWSGALAAAGPADTTFNSLNLLINNGRPIMWRDDGTAGGAGAIWRGSAIATPTWTKTTTDAPAMTGTSSGIFSGGALFPTGGANPDDLIVLRATTAGTPSAGSHRLVAMKWNAATDTYDASWYNVSLAGGLPEGNDTEVDVNADTASQKRFAAVRDTSGNLHAVYVNQNGDMVHYRKAVGFNDSWSRVSAAINPAGNIDMVALTALANNNLYLFYSQGDDVIYYRRFDGTSWGPESQLLDLSPLNLRRVLAPPETAIDCSLGLAFVEGAAPMTTWNIRFTLGVGSCGTLQTSQGAGTVTVAGPGSFEMTFDRTRGGNLANFYDLAEDPGRLYDLAGKPSVNFYGLFHSSILSAGLTYATGLNSVGAQLDLLEATPVRVRVRQEAFYGLYPPDPLPLDVLAGVKGIGDYSVYPQRLAVRWNRKTTAAVPQTNHPMEISVRREVGDPRDSVNLYTQTDNTFPNPGSDDFVLAQHDVAGVRTDILGILYADWPEADTLTVATTAVYFSWRDNGPIVSPVPAGVGPYSQQAGERWNFLIYYKPTTFVDNTDLAVTNRSNDFRTPSGVIGLAGGTQWQDAAESTSTGGDFFNEGEAAYVFNMNFGSAMSFDVDATFPRHQPFFKIRNWRSLAEAPVVSLEGTGLVKDVDYRAAVKPVARAHFAQDLTYHATLESATVGFAPPQTGSNGTVTVGVTFPDARYGKGAQIDADGEYLTIPSAGNFNSAQGAIEFWYRPSYNYGSGNPADDMGLFGYFTDVDNYFYAYHEPDNASAPSTDEGLFFELRSGGVIYQTGLGTPPFAPVYWRANEWVHLRFAWRASSAGTPLLEIYVNGQLVSPAPTGSYPTPVPLGPDFHIGDRQYGGFINNASGTIDEFYIYGRPDAPRPIAHGGLTSDLRELLADSADNFDMVDFDPIGALLRGEYLYFGADSKFQGLNVVLARAGSGVAATAILWEYWDGTRWSAVPGVTDETDSFTKPRGTIYWAAPASWNPYSVNGGPDLYYVRALLTGGIDYGVAMSPIESVIKTDILLFQYCNEISIANQTFLFAAPVPTEVVLESFGADPLDSAVELQWKTASELRNLGFHLYRGVSADGPWTRLNASLIPGLGSSAVGQAYSFLDSGLTNGVTYYYRLEDVDASSKLTSHGPVSAVPTAGAGSGTNGGGASSEAGGKGKGGASTSCPDWVLSAYGSASGASTSTASLTCTRHGDPEAVSLAVLSRDARQATLELRTGGFYALHTLSGAGEPSGGVRVFVPGFDFPSDPQAAALPIRRALVEAVVGRRVQLGGVRALDLVGFAGLVPSALGQAEMQIFRDGTVRAARRAARALSPRRAAAGLVKLLPSVFQGETKSAVVEISPLRFDARRQQLVLAKRVRVRLLFTGREAGESGRASRGRRAPGARKPVVTGEVLARLYTTKLGLHAVSFEQLFPAHRRGFSASQLRLERQGQAVGFHIEPASDSFGPGSRLFFHADVKAGSTGFSSETAWELVSARDGILMPLLSAAPGGDPLSFVSTGQVSFEANRYYQPGLLDAPDLWLWEGMPSGASRTVSFALGGVAASSSQPAELEVFLQGASESGSATDHHVSVALNGVPVGEARFAGKKPHRMTLSAPVSLLREGANELGLTNVPDTGVASYVFLDRFTVAYPQTSSLAAGVFEGTWEGGGTASVAGIAGPVALLDVTAAAGTQWLTAYETAAGSLRFRADAGHRYLAVSDPGLLAPRVAAPTASTLRSTENQADYILIAPKAFLTAAEPLLERRQGQGLSARAASFEEIAEVFGHGEPSADAIRSFLAYAFHSWAPPSPRYVLLVGDSSYDPRNFTGSALASPLPALWTKTSYLWTVSDPKLAAVNGEDSLPDLAIGRLPATTVAEAETLVAKLLAWEDSGQGLTGVAALVADNPDLAGDFSADIDDIAASFLQGRDVRTLKLSELGAGMRPAIRSALDSGLSFLNYVGHGGAAVWAGENVWNSWDAASLQAQSLQPLLVTLNCLNGYFVAPVYNALSESLVKAEGRGAIAGFSPSGLSLDGPAHQYHRALMAELTGGQHARLGDALLAAQKAYAETGLMPELLEVYHLLGDPATKIR